MGSIRNPWRELRAFARAALYDPVPQDDARPEPQPRSRRMVAVATLLVGALGLAATLRISPGAPLFYAASVGLAMVWVAGALGSGPLHLGRAHTRTGERLARPWVQSLALGTLLVALFCAGTVVVARIPVLREPLDSLLEHARLGSLPVLAAITAGNGIAEELYFRGAVYDAFGPRHALAGSTAVYAVVTAGAGNPLLVVAAIVLGLVCGLQRRVTGGIAGPAITHVMWSTSMLVLLPPILKALP